MKSKLILPAFIGLTITLFACDRVGSHDEDANGAAHAGDPAKDADAVKKVEQEMLAAFKARDAAKAGGYYADDAVLVTPGHAPVRGRDAIAKMLGDDMKDPGFSISFTPESAEASGDLAYTQGRFQVTWTDPATKKSGKEAGSYITVFERQGDGGWKVAADYATPGPQGG